MKKKIITKKQISFNIVETLFNFLLKVFSSINVDILSKIPDEIFIFLNRYSIHTGCML
jgi:hypothetical protein